MSDVDRDILISRVVDDEASPEDWARLKILAAKEPALWRELAEAQHLHASLSAEVDAATRIAERVEAPVNELLRLRFRQRVSVVRTWGGWAAAAAVTLTWLGVAERGIAPRGGSGAGLVPTAAFNTPLDAYNRYIEMGKASGQVVEAMPQLVLLDTQPCTTGDGYEVIYLRQVMERAVVKNLYEYGAAEDELGRPAPVRVEIRPAVKPPM